MSAEPAISLDSKYGQGPEDCPSFTKSSMSRGSEFMSGWLLVNLSTSLPLQGRIGYHAIAEADSGEITSTYATNSVTDAKSSAQQHCCSE